MKEVTLNPDTYDLECKVAGSQTFACLVPKSHFKGKENGYYYTYRSNYKNTKAIDYMLPPIKVILTKNSFKMIKIPFISLLSLLILLLF